MPHRVVAQPYDVVVVAVATQLLVETLCYRPVACLFGVDDYFRFRTHLTASLRATLYHAAQHVPVVALVVVNLSHRPQHAVCYLVSHLYQLRLSSCRLHPYQRRLGVGIHTVAQCIHGVSGPIVRNELLARVCPGVGVVEVEHQLHAFLLNLFAEFYHIVDVLTHTLALVRAQSLFRIHKEAHTDAVPSVLFEEVECVHGIPLGISIYGAFLFVGRQQRRVAAQDPFFLVGQVKRFREYALAPSANGKGCHHNK